MRTSFFSSSGTADTLKQDCRHLADDALKAARHMVNPAVEAAHRAGGYAKHAMHDAEGRLKKQMTLAERFASEQVDRTGHWVSSNPFKAVGIALMVGLVISSLFEGSHRK